VKEALGLAADHAVYAALAVGYPKYKYRRAIGRPAPGVKWR
jgi:hypothetical protein